jgi:methionyl-tRNA synthetase
MAAKGNYYITTAISYVNGSPHLGHAYEAISTDVMARFKRLDGFNVFFLTGTDEHGQKVEKSAIAAGKDPQAYTDEIAAEFQEMDKLLNISNDAFIRTTEPRHAAASQAIWKQLEAAGDIYLDKYAGWYSVRDEAYFDEGELTDGPDGKLAPSGAPVEWVEEPSYFFRLSAYTDKLLAYYEAHPDFIMPPSRRNEVVNFVSQGLRDLSISRTTFSWGVKVPDNPGHIMYVWLDALTNYITALGYPETDGMYASHWPADLHVIGKDIVRFHAVYWPAFLMSANIPLPKRVFGHGFLNVEGEKMSKSVGNVLSPGVMVEEFGLDQIRYFLLREVPYGSDGSISRESVILTKADGMLETVRGHFEVQAFHEALETIWVVVRAANGYVDQQAPWALRKEDPARMATVLYVLADVIRQLSILIQPFMPDSAAAMMDQLAIEENSRQFANLGPDGRLVPGIALPKPAGVFPRYVDESKAAE